MNLPHTTDCPKCADPTESYHEIDRMSPEYAAWAADWANGIEDGVYIRDNGTGARTVVYTTASYRAAVYAAKVAREFGISTVARDVKDDVWDLLQGCGIPDADSIDLDGFGFSTYPSAVQDWITDELLPILTRGAIFTFDLPARFVN